MYLTQIVIKGINCNNNNKNVEKYICKLVPYEQCSVAAMGILFFNDIIWK